MTHLIGKSSYSFDWSFVSDKNESKYLFLSSSATKKFGPQSPASVSFAPNSSENLFPFSIGVGFEAQWGRLFLGIGAALRVEYIKIPTYRTTFYLPYLRRFNHMIKSRNCSVLSVLSRANDGLILKPILRSMKLTLHNAFSLFQTFQEGYYSSSLKIPFLGYCFHFSDALPLGSLYGRKWF